MSTLKNMIAQIRISGAVADNAAVKYSDYQIISAINSAIEGIYVILSNYSTDITIKSKMIALTSGEAKLPSDFVAVHEVFGGGKELTPALKSDDVTDKTYKIRGNKIISGCSQVTLEYKYCASDLTSEDMDTELPLPSYFNSIVRSYAIANLTGTAVDTTLAQSMINIVQQRSFNKLTKSTSASAMGGWN